MSWKSKEIIEDYLKTIKKRLEEKGVDVSIEELLINLSRTPSSGLGDYGLPIFRYAKKVGVKPVELAKEIAKRGSEYYEILPVEGYVNVRIRLDKIVKELLEEAMRPDYGKPNLKGRYVVEHTSSNPAHPLHVGHLRNAVLGDTLARMFKWAGIDVETRFYINDMGRQVATLIYGVMALNELKPPKDVKEDQWYGIIYAITNAVIEGWEDVIEKYKRKYPDLVEKIRKGLEGKDHEKEISEIMRKYEMGDEELKKIFRTVVSEVLKGVRKTLHELNVYHDYWDWESDLVWTSLTTKIIEMAKKTPYITYHKGALALDFSKILTDEVRKKLRIPKNMEIPPLILLRSDGTTLYTTRDIAYSIKKFEGGKDKVINVIATEQRLPQAQIRLALYALGFKREAENLIHYAYEMVTVPGRKMSSRRGEAVTVDELIEEAKKRARKIVESESRALSEEEKEKVVKAVAIGALRYAMLASDPEKPIVFKWEEVLNVEKSSAPYIQYTYARAKGILRRAGEEPKLDKIDANKAEKVRELLLLIFEYPLIIEKAIKDMAPDILINYLNRLADEFNKFYQRERVVGEEDKGYYYLKLALVKAVANIIKIGLDLVGIEAPERM